MKVAVARKAVAAEMVDAGVTLASTGEFPDDRTLRKWLS